MLEVEVAPGGGNISHYHLAYDEHFEVLKGTLEVLVDKEILTLRPGQKTVAPKNVLHRFRKTRRGAGQVPGRAAARPQWVREGDQGRLRPRE